jgi:hypothetical protein
LRHENYRNQRKICRKKKQNNIMRRLTGNFHSTQVTWFCQQREHILNDSVGMLQVAVVNMATQLLVINEP